MCDGKEYTSFIKYLETHPRKRYYRHDIEPYFSRNTYRYLFDIKYSDLPLHFSRPLDDGDNINLDQYTRGHAIHLRVPEKLRLVIIMWRLRIGK